MSHKYNYIINPKTNRKVRVDTQLGQNILKRYEHELNGGGPWPTFFASKAPPRPKSTAFFKSDKGKALFKELKAKSIKCCWDAYSTQEELVQLLTNKGVTDEDDNLVTPERWETNWNAKLQRKKTRRDKKQAVLQDARAVLDNLYSSAFKNNLLSMEEPRRSSEADTREKALSNALEAHNILYAEAYAGRVFPDLMIKRVIEELRSLARPDIENPTPGKKASSKKKASPKKKAPAMRRVPISMAGIPHPNRSPRPNKGRQKMLRKLAGQ